MYNNIINNNTYNITNNNADVNKIPAINSDIWPRSN